MSGSAHFESLAKMFHQGEQKVSFGGVLLVCFFDLFTFYLIDASCRVSAV